jgi:hypothetical protein
MQENHFETNPTKPWKEINEEYKTAMDELRQIERQARLKGTAESHNQVYQKQQDILDIIKRLRVAMNERLSEFFRKGGETSPLTGDEKDEAQMIMDGLKWLENFHFGLSAEDSHIARNANQLPDEEEK